MTNQHSSRYLFYATQDYCFSILRPIQSVIEERGDEVAWFIHGNEISEQYLGQQDRRCHNVKDVFRYQPQAVITPNNTVPHFFPGIKVQVFHGFNARKRSRGALDSHFALRGFFDLYCTQGPSTTEVFQQLAQQHRYFRVIETGWPKMDPLFSSADGEKNRGADFADHDRPTIILASTFSRQLSCAETLLPTIRQLVESGSFNWYVQFHPKMDASVVSAYKALAYDNYRFIETDDVVPYLRRADVMVCDTSSILQEFMQLERPVVTFKNRTPGPWLLDIDNPEELAAAIDQALARPPGLMAEIRQYNARLHPYTDGRSSHRVMQAIDQFLASDRGDLKRKPLNLVRKLKIRRQLSWWWPDFLAGKQ